MLDIFKRSTNSIIISSILSIIVGIIMVINPEMSIRTISIVISIYIILYGILLIALDIKANFYYIPFNGFLSGILSIILGIVLLSKPNILSVIITIIIGSFILLQSIESITLALTIRSKKTPWIMLLFLGFVDLLAGILVLFNPFEAMISIVMFIGLMIIVHSVITIGTMLLVKRDINTISNTIKKSITNI